MPSLYQRDHGNTDARQKPLVPLVNQFEPDDDRIDAFGLLGGTAECGPTTT